MARSVNYPGWAEIEWELRFKEKVPEALEMFEDRFIRDDIDRICRESKKSD
jgi:hypothetical protein